MDRDKAQADVLKQLETLQGQMKSLADENARLRQDTMLFLSTQAGAAPQGGTPARGPAQEPYLDLETDMPDLVDSPKEYAREQARRIQAHNRAVLKFDRDQERNEEAAQSRDTGIIEQFKAKYPGYSTKVARAVAEDVIAKAQQRGINPNLYVYGQTDKFFEDVVTAYEAEVGKPTPAPVQKTASTAPVDPLEETLRTGGIFGGQESGSGTSDGGEKAAQDESFGDILEQKQAKSGLFW